MGRPFTAIVVGAGMSGAYCATKIVRLDPTARVLLLDAGRFLVSEHVQNLANIGFNVPGAIPPSSDPGVARGLVWGIPWRGNTDFPGLAYCTGGKSIFWGGWCPRLTAGDLAQWPATTAQYLVAHYIDVESEIGVVPATDFIFGELGRRAAQCMRDRRGGHPRYRHVHWNERRRDRSARGTGKPARVRPL